MRRLFPNPLFHEAPRSGRLLVPLALAAVLALGACAPRAPSEAIAPVPPTPPLLDPAAPAINLRAPAVFKVLFETSAGDFVVEVERDAAPLGADRFYNLVHQGYYDGVRFFRVVPGFVVQFGLSGDPEVAAAWRGARIDDDPVQGSNLRGTLTYAMAGPGTRTVQIFINLADNARLDAQGFAPFGTVTGGMDVVDRLYGGYGDGAPRGQGPAQDRITREGEAYLVENFPLLDRVIRARILEVPQPPEPEAEVPPPAADGR